MLSSRYRFHGHGSLKFVYARGQAVRNRYMVFKSTPNSRRTEPRVAVVISKKVYKSAVKRNHLRRKLYEIVRLELPNLTRGSDMVLIVTSPESLTLPPAELKQLVTRLFSQAGIYK